MRLSEKWEFEKKAIGGKVDWRGNINARPLRAGQLAFPLLDEDISSSLFFLLHARILATMSGFDADRVFAVRVHDAPPPQDITRPAEVERMLIDFLLEYRVGGEFIYRYVNVSLAFSSLLTVLSATNSEQTFY